jgi:hypothetical protein
MKITQAITILSAVVLAAGCAHEQHQAQFNPYDESISPYTGNGTARQYNNNNTISFGGSYTTPGGTVTGTSASASESDDMIANNVRETLKRNPEIAPIVPNMQISANNGIVELTGPVQSEEQLRQISSLVVNVGGVMGVNNQLEVPSNSGQNQNGTAEGGTAGTANQGTESGGAMSQPSGQNEQNDSSAGATNNMASPSQNPNSAPSENSGEGGTLNPTSNTNDSPSQIYQNSTNGLNSGNGELNPTSSDTNSAPHIYQEPGKDNQGQEMLNTNSNQQ